METYIVATGGKILQVYETGDGLAGVKKSMENEGLEGKVVVVPTPFEGHPGQDVREFNHDWTLRSLEDRLADGLIQGGNRLKVIDEYLVPKTPAELIKDGIETAPRGMKIKSGPDGSPHLIPMTLQEQVAAGQITLETAEALEGLTIRADRAALLSSTDWTQAPDVPLSADDRTRWAAYRQALRDVPEQRGFPWMVEWPKRPDGIEA